MEPDRPSRPEVELLETRRPPGAFERFTATVFRRRGVRVAGTVAAVVLVAAGAAQGLGAEEPPAAAQPGGDDSATSPRDPDAYGPPAWVIAREIGWAVLSRPEADPDSPVYVVTVRALNRSLVAARPEQLRAVGRFAGRPGFRFSARCEGFQRNAGSKLEPIDAQVEPGEQVLLRCTDMMEYSGDRPALILSSVRIQRSPCEHEGRGPGTL